MNSLVLTDEDAKTALSLEGTVLENVENHLVEENKGTILICCPDCDQFWNLFQYHASIQKHCRPQDEPRIMPLPWFGGSAILAPNSPLNENNYDLLGLFTIGIEKSLAMKGVECIAP